MLENTKKQIVREIRFRFPYYLLLSTILLVAFIIRVYRVNDLLGFYYDQGRDALVIWKFWHEGKPFLIGPVTGLQGIFLGPFYYYLITPFYLIGGGNPIYPAVFLSFLSVCAILMLYITGRQMHSNITGLLAAMIGAFSYYIFTHSRWLSNPNPILLTSVLLLYVMWKIIEKSESKKKSKNINLWWTILAFLVGISLQLESASAIFYLAILFIFFIWQFVNSAKHSIKEINYAKIILIIGTTLLITFIPQIVFNLRHQNILLNNFLNLILREKAFRQFTAFILTQRLNFFWEVFSNKLYAGDHQKAAIFIALSFSALFMNRKVLKTKVLKLFSVFLITPLIGYLFFQGNYGNIYDYYLSGYYFPFILLFAIGLGELWKTSLGKVAVLFFIFTFLNFNKTLIKNYLTADIKNRPIAFEEQLKAVNWVFDDAVEKGVFNLDVYVPPVIPYAYDYLFLWQGNLRQLQSKMECDENLCGKTNKQVSLLYLLYEEDPPNPDRLQIWLDRQEGIAFIEEEEKFGMITVQRRRRY
ncbi:hypothetical protein A2Z22_04220 [Candidatus Woesebacteria bacterium RBG_16_34_12]|uniref:Glycosyltransferase RgtA/B/C/D-like domain-containing protein n=1 Tax=Candidatus Woesebacteria bacterium RBG_16_34_12 TaxID=1802480 RepID=A0A1F7X8H7_9BACT|nr:MAG: hypothetical protein A2Z22_04220 [Candidatus Woesebacteria bacterium RBG_16_34_12]